MNKALRKRAKWTAKDPLNALQFNTLFTPSMCRQELTLADLKMERLFVRNHRGEYCHTGVAGFQFTDLDFM